MRYLKISGVVFLGMIFLSAGCDNLPFFAPKKKPVRPSQRPQEMMEVSGTVIAVVNNMPITLEELNEQVDSVNKLATEQDRKADKIDTREKKIKYLKDELIKQKLMYQEALARGIDKKDSVRKAIQSLKTSVVISELIADELGRIDVTSSEIEEYYNRYKNQFREPEERQVREINVSSEDEAKQVLSRYYAGEDFSVLARQYSKSDTASKGGDLGFMAIPQTEADMKRCDKFYEAAFSPALEPGSVSGIFRCPDGWYIIKLESKKEGKQRSMNEMWDEIKSYLKFVKQQQHIDNMISRLTQQAQISIDEGKIY